MNYFVKLYKYCNEEISGKFDFVFKHLHVEKWKEKNFHQFFVYIRPTAVVKFIVKSVRVLTQNK